MTHIVFRHSGVKLCESTKRVKTKLAIGVTEHDNWCEGCLSRIFQADTETA